MSRYDGPLLFCDLEATGLDANEQGASLLEMAFAITEPGPELEVRAKASLVIRPPGSTQDHDKLWASMAPVVREMHEVNGLWREATVGDAAWSIHDADAGVEGWLRENGVTDPIPLAGSGVDRYDRRWLERFAPRITRNLLYWAIDCGPIRRGLQYAGRDDIAASLVATVEERPHRALDDCMIAVEEMRLYLAMFRSIPSLDSLNHHFDPTTDPCQDRGVEWPCDVAAAFGCHVSTL